LKTHIIVLLGSLMFASCDNYLDVQPEDKYLEEQVFSSKTTILNALNGVYGNMTNSSTYGGDLTMATVDVLGQRYKAPTNIHTWFYHASYTYDEDAVKTSFNNIWTAQYATILSINNLIIGLDKYPKLLATEVEHILKGELYGLRAMLHFDLLRLFGPVYSTNAGDNAIPYYTDNSGETLPLSSAKKVIDMVLADLQLAEDFLSNDPVITKGPQNVGLALIELDNEKFEKSRHYRFNYYAVKALQARANLYAGNTNEALIAAKYVIENTTEWFPWIVRANVFDEPRHPDRQFSSEVIFGLSNPSLYQRYRDYFTPALEDSKILVTEESILHQIFDGNTSDYRYAPSWFQPKSGEKTYKTFYKFEDVTEKTTGFRYLQPLIRISEMYYIAAETETDPTVALGYLNTVRSKRGIPELTEVADIQSEILKEYKREFYGEGQLFFYYKRLNFETIENGYNSDLISMGSLQYVVPLPQSETEYLN
ncbi:MAG: RagB/SusD family nutrient uptake outer membrane protein, partial [Aestuariibaculum sp.]